MKALAYRLWTEPVLFSTAVTAGGTYIAAEVGGVYGVIGGLVAVVFAVGTREAVTPNRKLDE